MSPLYYEVGVGFKFWRRVVRNLSLSKYIVTFITRLGCSTCGILVERGFWLYFGRSPVLSKLKGYKVTRHDPI